jgi:uncharacterized RDD family membrane protein YckC
VDPALPPPPDQLHAPTLAPAPGAPPTLPLYAGFWSRFAALFIDGLVLAPLTVTILWPTFRSLFDEIDRAVDLGVRFDVPAWVRANGGRLLGPAIAVAAINYGYQAVMVGLWGATVGKFALHLRVRRDDGSPAGWREALLRPILQQVLAFARFAGGGLLGLIDYLWMLWDRQRQTLHDKVASTIVVRT